MAIPHHRAIHRKLERAIVHVPSCVLQSVCNYAYDYDMKLPNPTPLIHVQISHFHFL